LLLCTWSSSIGQPVLEGYPELPETILLRKELVFVAESQVGVRERTGKNDGAEVEMYLRTVGLGKGYAWCAAYVTWCHEELNIPNPQSAWSPSWFNSNVVYRKHHVRIRPFTSRKGQVFGLYYDNLKRIGHVGLITGEGKLHYYTVEGNTSGEGVREGDGVYRKIRRKENIHIVSDFVGYKEIKEAMRK
jgi:hypothetical protein